MRNDKEFYDFESKTWPIITGHQVEEILRYGEGNRRLKLGKRVVNLSIGENVVFSWQYPERGTKTVKIPLKSLRGIEREQVYTVFPDEKFTRASIFKDAYYQLKAPYPRSSFTLEIDGINMHAIKETTPRESTRAKVRHLEVVEGEEVLDICTGLGYSAIEERRRGGNVLTIEKNREVLQLAKINPTSEGLEDIPIILGDAVKEVSHISAGRFDKIFHDPPRFSIAGELYSLDFYRELQKVLRRNGRLFHYTGSPGKYQNKRIVKGIKERLREAKFKIVKQTPRGLLAIPYD